MYLLFIITRAGAIQKKNPGSGDLFFEWRQSRTMYFSISCFLILGRL